MIEIEYDPQKDAINRIKHGFGFDAVAILLEQPVVRILVKRAELTEERWIAIGELGGEFFTACYTMREARIRVISFRKASRKERRRYAESHS